MQKQKWFGLFLLMICLSFNTFAAERVAINSVMQSNGSSTIAVASTATVYTQSFPLFYGKYYGAWYKATSSGTVNLKIELEQSYKLPTTEGSADSDWAVIEDTGTIESALADETAHIDRIFPKPMQYGRLKITGGSGNDASTTLSFKVASQG